MKIESFGNFVLESRLSECTLHFGANLVCIHGDCIDDCKDNADCIFFINIKEDSATLFRVLGSLSVLDKDEVFVRINDNVSFQACNAPLRFYFRHRQEKLEELVNCFVDGNLLFPLDMNIVFFQYAKQLKITDRKAISNVMAAIDIPEIDNFRVRYE